MNAHHYYRFKALIRVVQWLHDNETTLSEVASVATVETTLQQMLQKIIQDDGISTADYSGHTALKAQVRQELTAATKTVLLGMHSLALATENQLLMVASNHSKSALQKKTDSDLLVFCRQIKESAELIAAQLVPYQIDDAAIALIGTLGKNFLNAQTNMEHNKLVQTLSHAEVIHQLQAAYQLMDKRLDALIDLFIDDYSDLVESYYLAREIGHHSTAKAANISSGEVTEATPAIVGPFRYGPTKGLMLVNFSDSTLLFQMVDNKEAVGRIITLAPLSAYVGVLARLADRGDSLLVTTTSDSPATYRAEIG